ncbi:MAG: hypothetical protein KJ646_03350 [Nanoarchaeota archaeon]|nr:hypothetical protein [Nanoarchaeota archaeon]MBU4116903.1 hypothetical protein [Nanoarchaeota archaeon]
MDKRNWISVLIIVLIIMFSIIILNTSASSISEEDAKCIGKNSELYVQLGCHACETQEKMFNENYKYLNVIDCFYEKDECIKKEISATPTWIINENKYLGVQSLEELKELAGC